MCDSCSGCPTMAGCPNYTGDIAGSDFEGNEVYSGEKYFDSPEGWITEESLSGMTALELLKILDVALDVA